MIVRLNRRLGLMSTLIASAVLALTGATATAAPSTATQAGPLFNLRNAADPNGNKCVGLANNGSTANGTILVLWDCHLNFDQWWYRGDDGVSLRSNASGYPQGKCIGLADNGSDRNGTRLVLWDCHLHPDQWWRMQDLGDGTFALVSAAGQNKCVGLANNGSTANGTPLVLWDCHFHPDQRWFTRS